MMIKAGIDINVCKPHSVRSAAASNAKAANASLVEIMQTAGWSSAATKHLQGPSDLNSRAVFFPVWTFAASLSASSRSSTGQ